MRNHVCILMREYKGTWANGYARVIDDEIELDETKLIETSFGNMSRQ